MGWCRGDALLAEAWEHVQEFVTDHDQRVTLLTLLINEFESMDMDCYDCIQEFPEGEDALRQLHPEWYEDE